MPSPLQLNVLNVGDGACSILGDADGVRAVLDCGSWRSGGKPQAHLLAQALGRRLSRVSTIVVSHFDADHWKGLQALASIGDRRNLPDKVAIRYPGLSRVGLDTTMGFLALRSLNDGVTLRAEDLISSWRAVAEVDPEPLFAGDELAVGSLTFDIVWPPRELPASWSAAARATLDELKALAQEIPALGRALDEVYTDAWPGAGQDKAEVEDQGYDRESGYLQGIEGADLEDLEIAVAHDLADEGLWEREGLPPLSATERGRQAEKEFNATWDEVLYEDTQGLLEYMGRAPGSESEAGIPPGPSTGLGETGHTEMFGPDKTGMPHRERLQRVARRLGVLNNHLSLVMVEKQTGFVSMGDVQGWSLRHVSRELIKIQRRYQVVLAPHHGTVRMPGDFPAADLCMLQCGPSHSERSDRHITSHQCNTVFATEVSGNWYGWLLWYWPVTI